jgi:hypothetical protein
MERTCQFSDHSSKSEFPGCQVWSSYLRLLSLLGKGLFTLLLPALLFPGEIFWAGDLVQCLLVQAADVNFRRCSNHISGVDSSEGDAIDLEGTGHQEGAFLEVLEEDDSLAAESAGEENEDGARLQSRSRSRFTNGLAGLLSHNALVVGRECLRVGDSLRCTECRRWVLQASRPSSRLAIDSLGDFASRRGQGTTSRPSS